MEMVNSPLLKLLGARREGRVLCKLSFQLTPRLSHLKKTVDCAGWPRMAFLRKNLRSTTPL